METLDFDENAERCPARGAQIAKSAFASSGAPLAAAISAALESPARESGAAPAEVVIRKARVSDVAEIHNMILYWSEKASVLRRTLGQIFESLQGFVAAVEGDRVVGAAALHIDCAELGEIRSVVVSPAAQSRGVGRKLVEALIAEAKTIGLHNVFCLTDKPNYFMKFGFQEIDKSDLPHKIWRDCINCPAFPDCHETALILPLMPNSFPGLKTSAPETPGE